MILMAASDNSNIIERRHDTCCCYKSDRHDIDPPPISGAKLLLVYRHVETLGTVVRLGDLNPGPPTRMCNRVGFLNNGATS